MCSGPVPVEGGRRCGNEGGLRRCCKQHRISLFVLTDQLGGSLPGAAHLDGLACMLKVSHSLAQCTAHAATLNGRYVLQLQSANPRCSLNLLAHTAALNKLMQHITIV